jgi:hypothetical protein
MMVVVVMVVVVVVVVMMMMMMCCWRWRRWWYNRGDGHDCDDDDANGCGGGCMAVATGPSGVVRGGGNLINNLMASDAFVMTASRTHMLSPSRRHSPWPSSIVALSGNTRTATQGAMALRATIAEMSQRW